MPQSLSLLLLGNFPGAKKLFSAPGNRKKTVARGSITGLGPGQQEKLIARGKIAGSCPWRLSEARGCPGKGPGAAPPRGNEARRLQHGRVRGAPGWALLPGRLLPGPEAQPSGAIFPVRLGTVWRRRVAGGRPLAAPDPFLQKHPRDGCGSSGNLLPLTYKSEHRGTSSPQSELGYIVPSSHFVYMDRPIHVCSG